MNATQSVADLAVQHRRLFFEEFGEWPAREEVGDWDSMAWGESQKQLWAGEGPSDEDYAAAHDLWDKTFFGEKASQ